MGLPNFLAAVPDSQLPALVNRVLCAALIVRSLLGIAGLTGSDSGYDDAIGIGSGVIRE